MESVNELIRRIVIYNTLLNCSLFSVILGVLICCYYFSPALVIAMIISTTVPTFIIVVSLRRIAAAYSMIDQILEKQDETIIYYKNYSEIMIGRPVQLIYKPLYTVDSAGKLIERPLREQAMLKQAYIFEN